MWGTVLKIKTLLIGALLFALAATAAERPESDSIGPIAAGEYEYQFSNWSGPAVEVRVYVPQQLSTSTPVLMVMHGWSREAQRYFDDWKTLASAQDFVVIVPHFPVSDFESSNDYNLGHVFDADSGEMRPQEQWTFSSIERIFDDVVARIGSGQQEYTLYGHSAGAQFVHRYLYYLPNARVSRYIAANAGWYTLPDFDTEYPYGLKEAAISEQALRAAFGKDMVLLLGREDIDQDDPVLRNTPEAKRQGKNRLARGLTMMQVAKTNATNLNADLKWRVALVEDAHHSNAKMAPAAATLIAADREEPATLFVGNSFTYYNNGLHDHVRKLLRAKHADGEAHEYLRAMAISGGELPEYEDALLQRLTAQSWDRVVLQGHSVGPITPGKAEAFREAARKYAHAIREHGAEPIFFMTWAYNGQPEMTAVLDEAYSSIGAELDAQVVPVGLAFADALSQRPELALIVADKKHPTLAGTYLAACTFYAAFYQESPAGLAYTAGLTAEDAGFLQQVAWQTWQNYAAR